MTRPVPIIFTWRDVDIADADGVVRTAPAMVPLTRFAKACERQYAIGENYLLVADENASSASRRHYFACLRTAWENLPESIAHRYPTVESLRKAALIKAGYRTEHSMVCASREEALKVAALIKTVEEYVVSLVRDNVVFVYTAQSQSRQAMKAEEFQASKVAVLDLVAKLAGTTAEELARHAKDEKEHARNPDHSIERSTP